VGANLRKIRGEIPRAFEVVSRDDAKDKDPSRKKISRSEAARRLEPIMGLVASGDVPMDTQTAEALAAYLESKGSH